MSHVLCLFWVWNYNNFWYNCFGVWNFLYIDSVVQASSGRVVLLHFQSTFAWSSIDQFDVSIPNYPPQDCAVLLNVPYYKSKFFKFLTLHLEIKLHLRYIMYLSVLYNFAFSQQSCNCKLKNLTKWIAIIYWNRVLATHYRTKCLTLAMTTFVNVPLDPHYMNCNFVILFMLGVLFDSYESDVNHPLWSLGAFCTKHDKKVSI